MIEGAKRDNFFFTFSHQKDILSEVEKIFLFIYFNFFIHLCLWTLEALYNQLAMGKTQPTYE